MVRLTPSSGNGDQTRTFIERGYQLIVCTVSGDVLGAADIFALSSDWEGNPLSVTEAMAAGLPVVSTAVGGVPELLENGKEGFIVRPGNTEQFSEAMMSLLKSGELRGDVG